MKTHFPCSVAFLCLSVAGARQGAHATSLLGTAASKGKTNARRAAQRQSRGPPLTPGSVAPQLVTSSTCFNSLRLFFVPRLGNPSLPAAEYRDLLPFATKS